MVLIYYKLKIMSAIKFILGNRVGKLVRPQGYGFPVGISRRIGFCNGLKQIPAAKEDGNQTNNGDYDQQFN